MVCAEIIEYGGVAKIADEQFAHPGETDEEAEGDDQSAWHDEIITVPWWGGGVISSVCAGRMIFEKTNPS